jgi:hypothetical protein
MADGRVIHHDGLATDSSRPGDGPHSRHHNHGHDHVR